MANPRKEAMLAHLAARPLKARIVWVIVGAAVVFASGWLVQKLLSGETDYAFLVFLTIAMTAVFAWQYIVAPARWAARQSGNSAQ